MLAHKTRDELIQIARNGGGFIIDGSRFTSDDIIQIMRNVSEKAFVQIENSDRFTKDEMVQISRNASGSIVFS
jgi:hypothetical protein